MHVEQGPIRPPSEASSLLIRVTRNCPWNKCAFCSTYNGKQFSRRAIEEIKRDIDTLAMVTEQVRQISRDKGWGGRINGQVVSEAGAVYGYLHYHVAWWLYQGAKNVFLQDANSLILKTSDLVHIIKYVRATWPSVERITTYARADTASRKNPGELRELREAGLVRIHMGMESGSDIVLKKVRKGITAKQLVEAGQKIAAAGISLCWYIIPGLGGREHSREHALETAAVINQGKPDFIRFRTLAVRKNTPLYEMMLSGDFTPLDEDEAVTEQRLLLASLSGVNVTVVSDHVLNLLQELEGTLPADRERLLGIIDRYLDMTPKEKAIFQLGRRAGVFVNMNDMRDRNRVGYVENLLNKINSPEKLQAELARMRRQFV
ncbi:radical SAM protein [Desulfallas thermosapovorans]|uniref:Radical SAM family protein n=1 Tax=Desulfallas thermosapovorans DSM 6562 TaxID=1121431 RepID=A0A5S4ZSX0_9FIRM|nr:radical SAM protein [Desulfallas thermosapovorans]TYO95947.1 radical SAM family protein [Desulfallas thermosapovorans DSM 6562]